MRRTGSHSGDMRRSSEPNIPRGMINGAFAARQQPPQAPVGQAQNIQAVAPQPQNTMQWRHQQQQAFGQQASTRHRSFAYSMDLISPTTSTSHASANGTSTFQPVQSHLFRSSSHHTSHTAAAGDLLTMSRRALEPSPPNQLHPMLRKRSSTEANGSNTSQSNGMSMNGNNSQILGQHHASATNPQQQALVPQHLQSMEQVGGLFPNTQDKSFFGNQASAAFQATASVSSSTVGTAGDNDESHQHHRTIRRCRRSDSSEMMEDG
mmetsp:Transcript_23199/g.42661  ORF Transcript_23199/g.42661 Transcript_23199/m.42661 type:complete len:264 (-) Transcript_23199:291-1082(-)|eukprot:CAMPEP_0201867430 /NCGR_PEP_ID=MMETSP0902-20130614/1656_1 /ASSEMBLY_ACC=CAM_ASM_000551 /TAXON_ID=420261 /ORGANISM="Thalassiosira antarctica, Strain CCMP982" /LENGTH=263 /DNA_ID=CAMNT_0048392579 /DNA_START=303 /DNA_END=1094 /DNA_ORIENTATION=-